MSILELLFGKKQRKREEVNPADRFLDIIMCYAKLAGILKPADSYIAKHKYRILVSVFNCIYVVSMNVDYVPISCVRVHDLSIMSNGDVQINVVTCEDDDFGIGWNDYTPSKRVCDSFRIWVYERINGVPGERTPDIHDGRITLRGERNVRIFTE